MMMDDVTQLMLLICSTKQDDIFVVYITNDDVSVLESKFKTEFLTVLAKHYKAMAKKELVVDFRDTYVFTFFYDGHVGDISVTVFLFVCPQNFGNGYVGRGLA